MNDPIAVWHDNEIIEGHGRLLAVMEMDEIEQVPVIRLDDLTDEQRKAYMLVHNKLTMNTGYDFNILQEELETILKIDMSKYGFVNDVLEDISDIDEILLKDENEEKKDNEISTIVFCPCCGEAVEVG